MPPSYPRPISYLAHRGIANMPKREIQTAFLRDDNGRTLEPGQLYAVTQRDAPITRAPVYRVKILIRGRVYLTAGFAPSGPVCRSISNLEAGGLQFIALDDEGRPINGPAEDPTPEELAERVQSAVAAAAIEAARIRARQTILLDRVVAAAGGEVSADFLDALATFIRDDKSPVDIAELMRLYNEGCDDENEGCDDAPA